SLLYALVLVSLLSPSGFLFSTLMILLPPISTLFPYTTLFRSYEGKDRSVNDIGDTYAEICITQQRMWCYKDGQLIADTPVVTGRSEEHTSELQSRFDLVCRLLLEKKKIRRGRELKRKHE